MWHHTAAFVIRFRTVLLLILLAATGVMGYFASKVEISYEFTNAIPTDNPKYKDYQEFRKQFGEDGNMMVVGVQTEKFFEPAFFNAYAQLVKQLEKAPSVNTILSIPGVFNLVKDTTNGKLKPVRLMPENGPVNIDSFRAALYNLPFYRGFLYNPDTKSYLMAISIDKKVLNTKKRTQVVKNITELRRPGLPCLLRLLHSTC